MLINLKAVIMKTGDETLSPVPHLPLLSSETILKRMRSTNEMWWALLMIPKGSFLNLSFDEFYSTQPSLSPSHSLLTLLFLILFHLVSASLSDHQLFKMWSRVSDLNAFWKSRRRFPERDNMMIIRTSDERRGRMNQPPPPSSSASFKSSESDGFDSSTCMMIMRTADEDEDDDVPRVRLHQDKRNNFGLKRGTPSFVLLLISSRFPYSFLLPYHVYVGEKKRERDR